MKVGDIVIVNAQFPGTSFDSWSDNWKNWVKKYQGKDVLLSSRTVITGLPGWNISPVNSPSDIGWIPESFLVGKVIFTGTSSVATHAQTLVKPPAALISYCTPCGGSGGHRLMCPTQRKTVKF